MEYIEGVRIDHVDEIRALGINPEIADRGFYAYLKQIFEDGFFHGDPHQVSSRLKGRDNQLP